VVGAGGPSLAQTGSSGEHFYIQGFGGANWVDNIDLVPTTGGPPGTIEFDVGYGVGGAVGYDFGQFRIEGEIAYRDNDIDEGRDPSGSPFPASGDISALSLMANAYVDIATGSALTPYIGGGIGAGQVDLSGSTTTGSFIDDDGWGFALQGVAGAGYALSDNVEVFAEGRILTIFDPGLSSTGNAQAGIPPLEMDDDYLAYGAFGGLRINFGSPPPPPPEPSPPAPEPEPVAVQTEFMVFFDWDESVLTPQANNTLDQVVVVYDENGFAQVNLAGHTDTSGPADYNLDLGLRRAESVRQGLVGRGVAPDEIVVRSFGETDLLVPTPDGVREPQNRRVEIVLM
jgi:outer membrane protein OmpA-like peptidoglycan-associated protein